MRLLSVLFDAAYFTDFDLFCFLQVAGMVNLSLRHGMTGASAHAYAWLGFILGPAFHAIARVSVSAGSRATWSRSMGSSPTRQRSTTRWEKLSVGRSRSGTQSISIEQPFAPRTRGGISPTLATAW